MDIEELSKTQIILLTLLVSFITSIATGIVTVSLLEQAPPGLTQTINRVVERTVERVVTEPGKDTIVTKETTVVVKEEDTITKAIDSAGGSVVAIHSLGSTEEGTQGIFLGWGVVIAKEGIVATDSSFVSKTGSYKIALGDGVEFTASTISEDEEQGIALLSVTSLGETSALSVAKLADSQGLRLGQTVISFGGKGKRSVSTGIISTFAQSEQKTTSTSTPGTSKIIITGIESTAVSPGGVTGGPLLNVFGDVVGISIEGGVSKGSFYKASNVIKQLLEAQKSKSDS